MSAFFVGQRVRVVRTHRGTRLLGAETHITAWAECVWSSLLEETYSGWQLDLRNSAGHPVVAPESFIEPILPSGAAPSEFQTLADLLTSLDAQVPA